MKALEAATSFPRRLKPAVGTLALLLSSFVLWNGGRQAAPVVQEVPLLASGCITRSSGTFDCFAVNPPLVRLVASLFVPLHIGPREDYEGIRPNSSGRFEFVIGQKFTQIHGSRTFAYLKTARLTGFIFFFLGLAMAWRAGDDKRISAVALLLWCFSPAILGHSATIMNDVPAAAMGLAAVLCFWKWLKRPGWAEAIIAGSILGLAELCKFTLLVFYPLFVVIWLLYRLPDRKEATLSTWSRQAVQLAAIFVISIYIINAGYLFEGTFTPLEDFRFKTAMFSGCESLDDVPPAGGNRFEGTLLGKVPVALPANMIQGIDAQRYDFERGAPSYLRGEHAERGWWYYYLYAMLVKMPLGTWGLLFLAIFCTVFFKGYNAAWRDEMVVLLPLVTLFVFVSSQTGFSVHSRYVLPALPFLFLWISKTGKAFSPEQYAEFPRSTLVVRGLTIFFLGWTIVSSMAVCPHSLAYFNELAAVLPTPYDETYPEPIPSTSGDVIKVNEGVLAHVHRALTVGPQHGPRHLLDSNIDWGQDLFCLETWCEEHPEARPLRVAYWGTYPLEFTTIESTGHPPIGPEADYPSEEHSWERLGPLPGWHALSVNEIYSRSKRYRYFLNYEPVAMAGYSIYIYHITLDDANRVRRELGLPELAEDWEREQEHRATRDR